MSGRFVAFSGRASRWTLPIQASFTTTLKSGASLISSSAFHSSQSVANRRIKPWPEWLSQNPTSAKDVQKVYDACVESRVFAPTAQRPLDLQGQTQFGKPKKIRWGDSSMLKFMFMRTDGLTPQDWEARGINFHHALNIAKQLQLQNHFSGKDLTVVLKNWSEISVQAQRHAAGVEPAKTFANSPETIAERRKALMEGTKVDKAATMTTEGHEERKGLDRGSGARHVLRTSTQADRERAGQARRTSQQGNDAEGVESMQADQARRVLRQRKKAEQASDAEEGIKSKRRPLRLAATSKGVPLTFETMDKLRRVERRGREIIVDKEVRQRTRGATIEKAQQKRDEAKRANRTITKPLHQENQHSSKEQRSTAALGRIKALATKNSKALEAIIKQKETLLKQDELPHSRQKTAERQLKRAKQALAMQEWDARQGR